MAAIAVAIWGPSFCDNINPDVGNILAIKGARVTEYGGRSLNVADDHATVYINPNIQ